MTGTFRLENKTIASFLRTTRLVEQCNSSGNVFFISDLSQWGRPRVERCSGGCCSYGRALAVPEDSVRARRSWLEGKFIDLFLFDPLTDSVVKIEWN